MYRLYSDEKVLRRIARRTGWDKIRNENKYKINMPNNRYFRINKSKTGTICVQIKASKLYIYVVMLFRGHVSRLLHPRRLPKIRRQPISTQNRKTEENMKKVYSYKKRVHSTRWSIKLRAICKTKKNINSTVK